jgi:hypothetical protein
MAGSRRGLPGLRHAVIAPLSLLLLSALRRDAKLLDMDAALASLHGVSIGAITGVCGGFVAGSQQRKGETLRWRQARADELRKEERRSLLELTSLLAKGSQAAAWLCWAVTIKPADAVKASLDTKLGTASFRLDAEPEETLQELKSFPGSAYQLTRDVVLGVRSQLRVDRANAISEPDAS